MSFSRRDFFLTTASLFLVPQLAQADEGAANYVHQLGVEVLRLAQGGHRGDKALQHRFASLLNRYINIPGVANFALGQARASLPEGDKAMFYDLVANYSAALFVWYVDDFQGSNLKVNNVGDQGRFTNVDSTIVGTNAPLRWRVSGSGGGYKVADLNVKGVWLTIAMKDMFTRTLASSQGDFKPLYAKLRESETW